MIMPTLPILFLILIIATLLLLECSQSGPVSTISAGPVTESLLMETASPVVLSVSAVWRPAASATSWQW